MVFLTNQLEYAVQTPESRRLNYGDVPRKHRLWPTKVVDDLNGYST